MEQHEALAAALKLPSSTVGGGFNYIESGELPDGVAADTLLRTRQHIGPASGVLVPNLAEINAFWDLHPA